MRSLVSVSIVVLGASSISACSPDKPVMTAQSSPASVVTVAASPPATTLPISLNAVMVALVDHASEPLWLDAYNPPNSDARWRDAEYNAQQMAVSGKLIQLAGTGPNDIEWVANPEWKIFADEMTSEGSRIVVRARLKGVHEGEFGDIQPTFRKVEFPFIVSYEIVDNKIVSHWLVADQMVLLEQLGAEKTLA